MWSLRLDRLEDRLFDVKPGRCAEIVSSLIQCVGADISLEQCIRTGAEKEAADRKWPTT